MVDFVIRAEEVVKNLRKDKENKPCITTSQLRKFLSAVNSVANKVQQASSGTLSEDLKNEIQYLRVKLAYQAGRYSDVKELAQKADLDKEIQNINTTEDFDKFFKFIEAIVAYHKFNGGN